MAVTFCILSVGQEKRNKKKLNMSSDLATDVLNLTQHQGVHIYNDTDR
ncbi:hypothetical protein Krac_11158 [Ktedonobacter racemifer DSM 44963]|uniref:Uncharacterized protein n=1 Tax=Ktedonobacter racemifer DSM 44963 TaxID=485913 RepID=D6TJI6_KTERA|nr:hypothetical protein Krac_11158 [Ktedonobacter racemifer DSM 44963]